MRHYNKEPMQDPTFWCASAKLDASKVVSLGSAGLCVTRRPAACSSVSVASTWAATKGLQTRSKSGEMEYGGATLLFSHIN